jgi:Short-chain dehydrogenases of various substrate specificities
MPTALITGCDTGIGREFAEQYARDSWKVIATYRDISKAIPGNEHIRNHPLDVTDESQFESLKEELDGEPIDLLISNAGIGLDTARLGALDFDYARRMYEVNTIGPLRLVETFAGNVAASTQRRIVAITSRMGSIGLNLSGAHYGYRASKAGLNALMRSLAIDLFGQGITVVLLHPGWVDTAGGGGGGALSATASVSSMRQVIARLGNHETGQFLSYDGTPLPW